MPRPTVIAFVVIRHRAPDFDSMMDARLARHTDNPIRPARMTAGLSYPPVTATRVTAALEERERREQHRYRRLLDPSRRC